ncbi:polysaccharide biosynthesis tyrosine autokinase [Candidatus Poribacteria bacterium]|nr:polysaccharide biosynthesis tyrosine autokinase [Candidatus Poribacteria bacterium]
MNNHSAAPWIRPSEISLHLKDYLRVVSVRRWIPISVFALVVLSVAVWVFVRAPIYRAESLLLIEPAKVNLTEFKEVYDPTLGEAGGHLANQEFLETQYKLIVCRPILERTFEEFHFGDMEEFRDKKEPIEAFAKLFSVVPARRSRLAAVTFEWKDPELAARVLNFLVTGYISDYRNRALGVTREGLEALRQKNEELRPQVETKANELQKFMVKYNMVSLEKTQNIVVERLKEINKNLIDVEKKRIEVESDYRSIERALRGDIKVENLPEIARSETIRDLKLEYIKTKQRFSDLGKSFGPNHPEVKAAQAMLDAIKEKTETEMLSILGSVKSEYDRALRQERQLRAELKKQEEEVMDFNKIAVQYKVLTDESETLSKTYNAVAKRIEEIEIATAAGSKGDNIFIITHPRVPAKPVKPRKAFSLMLASFVGLSLGLGLCFFVEYLDTTIKTKDDVESLFGVPVIGYVPAIEEDDAGGVGQAPPELHLLRDSRSPVAEAFRSIRTALAFSGMNGSLKNVLVTSASRGEGKSLSSVNIAVMMAQTGKRVILIDADMRKPRLHKIFSAPSSPGLSNLLAGEGVSGLREAIQPVAGIDGLKLLTCGPLPPNPAELLNNPRMKSLIEEMDKEFDVVVFDTPPLVSVTDAAVLSQHVRNIVMVVRSFSTQKELLSRARDIVVETQSRVLGIVLNNADVPRGTYHSYYYGDYYGYGYGADDDDGDGTHKRRRHKSRRSLERPLAVAPYARIRKSAALASDSTKRMCREALERLKVRKG